MSVKIRTKTTTMPVMKADLSGGSAVEAERLELVAGGEEESGEDSRT